MSQVTIIDGVFTLRDKVGEGGMAAVFLADADLTRFDYSTLYAYTQVQGATHAERRRQAEAFAKDMAAQDLDVATVRKILELHKIPLPGETVAIKVSNGKGDLRRFEAEWKNLLCLNHENVIKVFAGGMHLNRPWYAMEYLPNIVPPEEITAGFTIRQKVEIIIQAGRGLAYLHENGIIHRDVKPANMVVCEVGPSGRRPVGQSGENETGRPLITRVTDLGLAKDLDASVQITQSDAVMGTPYYMSPEQMISGRNVDQRADVYSLGASLYALIVRRPPYHDKTTIYELIASVTAGERPTPPEAILPNLPTAVVNIINCAMAYAADDRYASTLDMAADLETYLREEDEELLAITCAESTDLQKSQAHARAGAFRYAMIGSQAETVTGPAPSATATPRPCQPTAPARPSTSRSLTVPVLAGTLVLVVAALLVVPRLMTAPPPAVPVQPETQPRAQPPTQPMPALTPRPVTQPVAQPPAQPATQPVAQPTTPDVIAEPKTPREYYHNARRFELDGDVAKARQAYAAYFAFNQEFVDPHLDFGAMLRMQDGIEGARETYQILQKKSPTQACRLGAAMLLPRSQRIETLRALLKAQPQYGPAAYTLAYEFSPERLGDQTGAQKRAEKEALDRFVKLDEAGHFLKYYLDKKRAEAARTYVQTRLKALAAEPAAMLANPVRLTAMRTNQGWMLTFQVAEPRLKAIWYRLGDKGEFKSTGFQPTTNMQTGLPLPNCTIDLPLTQPRTEVQVKFTDVKDTTNGPFTVVFNPKSQMIASTKHILALTRTSWVALREFQGKLLVYFTHLITYRDALKEVRYSLDSNALDRRFALPKTPGSAVPSGFPIYIAIPPITKQVVVQLIFADDTRSEPQTFTRP